MVLPVDERYRQQLRLFDAVSSTTPDFLYAFDLDGKFVYANRRLLEVWGKSASEAVGKSLTELGYPKWHAEMHLRELAQVIETRQPVKGVVPFTGGSGISGVYEYIFTPVCGADGRVEIITGTTRDVTDRTELLSALKAERSALAEERTKLDAERSKLAAVIEQAPAFMAVLRGPSHVFELANERYFEIVGRRDVLGKSVRDALPEVEGQGFFERIDRVYQTGQTFAGNELPVLLGRGAGGALERRYMNLVYQAIREVDGTVSGVFVHGIDVTDLVAAREAIGTREAQFRQLADAMPQIVWAADAAGTLDYYNRRWFEYIGLPETAAAEAVAWDRYVHPDDVGRVGEAWTASLRTGRPYQVEFRVRSAGGKHCWFLVRAEAVRDADGRIVRWYGTCTDVEDRVRTAARDRFLVSLDEAVRPLTDPAAITAAHARLLGEHLGVDRCAYADVEADQDTFNLTGDFTVPGMPSVVGRYRFADFGPEVLRLMRADEPFVVDDVDAHQPPIADLTAYRLMQFRAVVCVPLHKGGRFAAAMAVHHRTPRAWGVDEAALVRQVAARCWESIERARVERSLRASELRWQLAVRGSNDGIWDWDVVADGLYWSPRCKEMLGYADDELSVTPSSVRDLIHPDDRSAAHAAFGRHLAGETPSLAIEQRLRHKDGSYRWVLARGLAVRDDAGHAVRMVGSHTDVTLRKDQELAQLHLAAIVESSDDAIISKSLDGVIQTWNAGAQRIFGYTAAEAVGRPVLMLLPPDRHPEEPQILARLRAGERLDHYESVRLTKDGRLIDVSLTISPMRDAGGRIVGASKVGRDITRQKQAERELQAAKAAAEAANRRKDELLESERAARSEADRASRVKDEFLATLSHELRTPLNAILGWSQIARRNPADVAGTTEALATIERNARTQAQIIDDLLDMSRIISGKIRLDVQPVDLSAVVRAAVETVVPAADAKGIRLRAVFDPHAGPVSGDPNRLQQVFWNLMTNAVKFTPKGGRVQVTLARVNSHLEIQVVDTGQGIGDEFLPHVFDRFRQADGGTTRRHGGLGLGLAIVKQLVELHGGTVQARSGGPELGSTFTVNLPLTVVHPEPNPAGERRHPSSGDAPGSPDDRLMVQGVRVLVVDDEPDARALVRRVLIDAGAVVTTAGSADEAVGLVAADRPDLLVSDIGMPGEDGYSLIARVRALGPDRGGNLPAIALTAYARAEDRMRAIVAGFEQHLAKPVEPAELVTLVAVLAARRQRK